MIKKVIIFGCGDNGIQMLNRLPPNSVAYFCDNNSVKVGKNILGIEVISFNKLKQIHNDYDIIVSPQKNEEICLQLSDSGITYYLDNFSDIGYFFRDDVIKIQDEFLFDKYRFDHSELNLAFEVDIKEGNWFRIDYYDEMNKNLICAMKKNNQELVKSILTPYYAQFTSISENCCYENRPAMRLINNILKCDIKVAASKKICDLGCGKGTLLSKLADYGFKCVGVDLYQGFCDNRIELVVGSVNSTPFSSNSFDYVTCLECLEHVEKPTDVIKEMHRILKPNGTAIVTVPFGKSCDCPSHVRQFDTSLIYSLFKNFNFDIANIIKVPATNNYANTHIFLVGKKKES